jgi:peptidoglycan/xylan/chitin deacetylase (PgdA/CDA1 family)
VKAPAFVLSLDFELIWGTLDLHGPSGFGEACRFERRRVVQDLLRLLDEFQIEATWCTVGHLFLDRCDGRHANRARPRHSWHPADWFQDDPGGAETDDSIFLGRSLVERILACPTRQEIGFHSFSHMIWGDPGCSRAVAESEIDGCFEAASWLGFKPVSWVFPRNRPAFLNVLASRGIRVYRGPGPRFYEREENPGSLGRLAHLAEVALRTAAPTVRPVREKLDGGAEIVNLPGSMIYFPAHGVRGYIPMSNRVARAEKAIARAIREGSVFHLWFHPTNLADRYESMMSGLREIFTVVRAERERGRITTRPMGAFAA